MYKKLFLFFLLFSIFFFSHAQTVYTVSPNGFCASNEADESCGIYTYYGKSNIKVDVSINNTNSTVTFTASRCNGSSNFVCNGNFWIKENSYCASNSVTYQSFSANAVSVTTPPAILDFTTGSKIYYPSIVYTGGGTCGNSTLHFKTFPITITAIPKPNLTISSVTLSSQDVPAGSTVAVYATIQNTGNANAPGSIAGIYLSGDSYFSGDDVFLGNQSVPKLDGGFSTQISKVVTIPESTLSSNYYILVVADYNYAIDEYSETDNTGFRYINITSPLMPDLVINTLSATPDIIKPGNSFTAYHEVKNQGTGIADFNRTNFWLSADNVYSPSTDTWLGNIDLPQISAGGIQSASVTLPIPANTQAGTYYLFADADANHNVLESNEENNYTSIPITVDGSQPCSITGYPLDNTELIDAVCYLIQNGILDPNQDYSTNINPIIRQDLAKVSYKGVFGSGETDNPAMNFPTPYHDLQVNTNDYFKYALALLYLEFTDKVSPFSRAFTSFHPTENITRVNSLKVLLETFNIDESTAIVTPPYDDIGGLNPQDLAYVKKAYELGIIKSAQSFHPTDPIIRNDCFLMLYRLLINSSINKPTAEALQNKANYYQPFNMKPDNMNQLRSLAEGNFVYYENPAFTIPDKGIFSLSFSHQYFAQLVELPDSLKPKDVFIFGDGWTHNFLSYIKIINEPEPVSKRILYNISPDGSVTEYDATDNAINPVSLSKGNYDKLSLVADAKYILTDKSQIQYTYEQKATEGLYMLTGIIDRNGNKLTITYIPGTNTIDEVRPPSYETTGRKLKLSYLYDDLGNPVISIAYPLNRILTYEVHNGELTIYSESANTGYTEYSYTIPNQPHLLNGIKLPKGNSIQNDYNSSGKVFATTTNDINNDQQKILIAPPENYNPDNADYATASITYQDNKQTIYTYNNLGLPTNVTSPTGSVTMQYDNVANPTLATFIQNSAGASLKFENIDANGNPGKITYPNGSYETFTYNTDDNTIDSYTDRENHFYSFLYYDHIKGRVKQINLPYPGTGDPRHISFTYNSDGSLFTVLNPESILTEHYYNKYGNDTMVKVPQANSSTRTTYDDASRPVVFTDAKGNTTSMEYWDCDIPKTMTDPNGNTTQTLLDANYNITDIINAKGDTTHTNYDDNDRVQDEKFLGFQQYEYYSSGNNKGKLSVIRKPVDGNYYFHYYDNTGLLKDNSYINSIDYDPVKNTPIHITKGTLTLNLSWDAENNLSSYTDPFNNTITYTRRDDESVQAISYPNGNKVTYVNDGAGRLQEVWWNKNAVHETKVASYSYYADNRISKVEYGNGIYTNYAYDEAGRNTGMYTLRAVADTISAYTTTLDANGQITAINTLQEPIHAIDKPDGEISFTYKQYNVLENGNGIAYTVNANGNVLNRGSAEMQYDVADNLTSYTNGTVQYNAVYDGLGLRREAVRNGKATRYILDISGGLDNVLAETDNTNTVQYYYVHGMGMICRIKQDGSIEYYHPDYRGNIVAMTNATKQVTHSYAYNEYGELLNKSETDENLYRFMGGYGITYEDSCLYYVRARHYDPTTGRFYSQDPVWGVNLYNYAGNNPVNAIDPSGRDLTMLGYMTDLTTSAISALPSFIDGAIFGGYALYYKIQGNNNYAQAFSAMADEQADEGINNAIETFALSRFTNIEISESIAYTTTEFGEGATFSQYKKISGGTKTLSRINTPTGAQRISTEFHHAFITQQMQRNYNIPNWIVNNSVNVWKVNTIQHSLLDPSRYIFLKAGMKPDVGLFKKYNWFTKF